jgi:hypothetical protein
VTVPLPTMIFLHNIHAQPEHHIHPLYLEHETALAFRQTLYNRVEEREVIICGIDVRLRFGDLFSLIQASTRYVDSAGINYLRPPLLACSNARATTGSTAERSMVLMRKSYAPSFMASTASSTVP